MQALVIVMAMMIFFHIMALPENEFEPKLGKPPADQAPKLAAVRTAVSRATRRSRTSGAKPCQPSVRAHFAKGSSARSRPVAAAARRVVVKLRYAANGGGRAAPLRAHIAYLSREGARRSGMPEVAAEQKPDDPTRSIDYLTKEETDGSARFVFYDRASDAVDARAATTGWSEDARHFRMIVSPEDGEALGDLKPFIREVMAGFEAKLGTRLAWVAVDHHDTDNPHTHVLIQGRRGDGQELFIPSRLISSGIREHAQEIVTRVLGPRLEADLVQERFRDIDAQALTGLDRELLSQGRAGTFTPSRPDLAARLERLEGWGLAAREPDGWRLELDMGNQLRLMAEREGTVRLLSSSISRRPNYSVLEASRDAPLIGELVHVGLADEFGDRLLVAVETGAGEIRYARFERPQDMAVLAGLEPGAMVTITPNRPELRPSDHAVAEVARRNGGTYSSEVHVALKPDANKDLIAANIRRLEAMRRMGVVQRSATGEFPVGANHLATALTFEERLVKRAPFSSSVNSYWSLSEQITADGPTYLDQVMRGEAEGPSGGDRLARDFEQALRQRRLFLIEQGWMGQRDMAPSLQTIRKMAAGELSQHAKALSKELGVPVLTHGAHRVSGVYARRIDLAQGRMALILGERQGHLVPWRPPLEKFAGRDVEGVMRGQGMSWSLQRGMGLGRGV